MDTTFNITSIARPLRLRTGNAACLALLLLGLMAGCRPDGAGDAANPDGTDLLATPEGQEGVEMTTDGESGEPPEPSRDIPIELLEAPEVAAALEAAARDAGVQLSDVSLLDVHEVTWPDSGLGCGEPGASYLQVLTPGFRVVIWAAGARVIYHTTRGAQSLNVVQCDNARSKGMSVETLAGGMLGRIMDDLRERVGEDVEIVPLGLNLVPVTSLTCDDLQVGLPTADPSSAGSISAMRLAVTEFKINAGGAIHVYRAYEDEFLHCGQHGVDAEGNPTD